MWLEWDNLPESSRVWIYQADRVLTPVEVASANESLKNFVDGWAAHGKSLNAHARVVNKCFIVIACDESAESASGCSIDASVSVIRQLGDMYGINFFDRLNLCLLTEEGERIISALDLQPLLNNETINADTVTFNNLVATKGALLTDWMIPLKNSWVSNRLNFSTESMA